MTLKIRKFIFTVCALMSMALSLEAVENSSILKTQYAKPGVAESFKAGKDWYPYPAYKDRSGWDKLLTSDAKKKFIKNAEKCLSYKWQHLPASTFLALETTGDKQAVRKIEAQNRETLISLMMGELAEGKGRFLPALADGLWFYGTSFHWSLSNQTHGNLPRYEMEKIGLGSIRHGATIPIVWYFFREEMDKIDPSINDVVEAAVKRIIIDPAMEGYGTENFRWLGDINDKRSNWNPWCNHGALLAILLMETDQDRLNAAVKASVENVDKYIEAYADDGACEEGVGYWGQSVGRFYEYLQLLYDASGGKFDVFSNEYIRKMAEYPSRVHAGMNSKDKLLKANYGDGNATGGSSPMIYYKVGVLFRHDELREFAIYQTGGTYRKQFCYPNVISAEGYRQLETIRHYRNFCEELDRLNQRVSDGTPIETILEELRRIPHQTWYPAAQQAMLRTGDNWFLGAKAGHNGEVHGHNDVGSFVLYVHNIPFLVDPGVGTYVKDTFGKNRFKIWSMTADWHNCPAPNGVQEKEGAEYRASVCTLEKIKKEHVMTCEFAGAFPEEAACKSYVRTFRLTDSNVRSSLVITDEYELTERKAPDQVQFITPGKVTLIGDGLLTIENDGEVMKMSYPLTLSPEVEERKIDDDRIGKHWNGLLRAIRFKSAKDAPLTGTYTFELQMR